MSEDQTPKKHRKREARYFSWQGDKDNRGRKADQKMKPFLTLAYLWKYSDENHVLSARDIIAKSQIQCPRNLYMNKTK